MKKHASGVLMAAAVALALAAAALAGGPGGSHRSGWAVDNDTCGAATTGSVGFVKGPGNPPAGRGSVQFKTGANGDSYPSLRTARYDGTKLSSLTALAYYTYVSQAVGTQAPYLDLYVDNNGDGTRDDILTFEPTYNGTVEKNTWQRWDALAGKWWSDAMGGPPPLLTLSAYAAVHPDAAVLGGSERSLILAAGCGAGAWTNFVGNADKLTVGVNGHSATYDFDPGRRCHHEHGKCGHHGDHKAQCHKKHEHGHGNCDHHKHH